MPLTDRVLPPEEWDRLVGMDLAQVLPYLRDAAVETQIAVVENEAGAIVGCWAAMRVIHVEGVWIDPAYRGRGSVARRLWRRMRTIADRFGSSTVVTASMDPDTTALLTRRRSVPLPQEFALCLR